MIFGHGSKKKKQKENGKGKGGRRPGSYWRRSRPEANQRWQVENGGWASQVEKGWAGQAARSMGLGQVNSEIAGLGWVGGGISWARLGGSTAVWVLRESER